MSGFLYPHIHDSKCIDCYLCQESCPVLRRITANYTYEKKTIQHAYAAWSTDDQLRFDSTSGGLFTELAIPILSNGGLVYGAGFNRQMDVVHYGIERKEDIGKLRKSKYVQSSIGYTYREIQEQLKEGRPTLFVGSPCQVAGLYDYLDKDPDQLYTIEFVCLGVNSPLAYRKWLEELEKAHKSKVSYVWFKHKIDGWRHSPFCTRIEFEDGTIEVLDHANNYYMQGFLQGNYYLRSSCSSCKFMGNRRVADIILGDYWSVDVQTDDDKGTSVIITNSNKGESLLSQIKERIHCQKIPMESIYETNPRFNTPIERNPMSESFFADLQKDEFSMVVKKYINSDDPLSDILKKIVSPTNELTCAFR